MTNIQLAYKDNGGRIAITVVKGEIEKLIVVNVYVPCDPVITLDFMGTAYDKINMVAE